MAYLTKEGYLASLIHIREVLINEIKHLDENQDLFYISEIAIKLRILYLKKSRTESLLRTIEDFYYFKIKVLVGLSIREQIERGFLSGSLADGMVMNQVNSVASWFREGHGHKELVSIFEAINKEDEIIIGEEHFSYKDIIETVADKMGGAHIDEKIPDKKLIPFFNDILIGGLSPAFRTIYDVANASIILINMIEQYISSPFKSEFLVENQK